MNTKAIWEHLLSKAPWVNIKTTVDTIKAGDPEREIRSAAVGWMSTMDNLRTAHEMGCELFVTHEPTFWHHSSDEMPNRTEVPGIAKQKFLDETGMVILRVHDIWDPWQKIGIRDSWAHGLGLDQLIAEDEGKYVGVYNIPETTLGGFAKHVAEKIKPLGQDVVRVLGEPEWRINHPAVGTGCFTPGMNMVKKGADLIVACDDGFSYWNWGARLYEMGIGCIVVAHGTSEMWGIENLARYLAKAFPELEVTYLDRHPRYWSIVG